jgi:hypothetical protein
MQPEQRNEHLAASARRDWAIVNAWLLMKHRHVHPLIREAIRRWIAYGKEATT